MRPLLDADRRARGVFLLAVALALAVSLWAGRRPVTPGVLAVVVAGGLAYAALAVYGGDLCERRRSLPIAVGYFGVQLAIAAVVLDQIYRLHTISIAWIILLPLVGQTLTILPPAGTWIVALLGLAVFLRPVVLLGGWGEVPAAAAAFVVSCLFVAAFVQLALDAERARAASARLAGELAEARRRIAEYAVEATELATAKERTRLAREIHDSVGHCLTVANVQIEAARTLLDADRGRAAAALDKAQKMTREGLADIRRSVTALRASPLDGRSLADAVRELAGAGNESGVPATFETRGEERSLPPPAELTLYRAAQEALTNVEKHSRAGKAEVVLDYRDAARVRLTVADDGVGCDGREEAEGFGLLGLRERLRLVDGSLGVESAPGRGTTLSVEVPG